MDIRNKPYLWLTFDAMCVPELLYTLDYNSDACLHN